MASKLVICVALVAVLPLVLSFAPTLRQTLRHSGAKVAICRNARASSFSLRMSEAAAEASPDVVAGIEETSDGDQRALKKTHTSKRPKDSKKKNPLSDYQVGSTVTGKVVSIMPYGAFVDIGATTDGLVHVSQLSNEFVSDISTVVKVGDEVQVRIVSIEADVNKISLSMRTENAERKPRAPREGGEARPQGGSADNRQRRAPAAKELPDEFKNFDAQKILKGKVASILDFGCFVSLAEGVDALVHFSEMSDERNVKPETLVKVGQEVDVRIINYDKEKKRLSLSMKPYVAPAPRDETEDIKSYVDPVIEGSKTSFQIAWERAQSANSLAAAK